MDIDNKLYGINNRKGKELKVKTPKQKYNPHRSNASRGCYRTQIRSNTIDENYINSNIYTYTYTFWDCKPWKQKVY